MDASGASRAAKLKARSEQVEMLTQSDYGIVGERFCYPVFGPGNFLPEYRVFGRYD